MHGVVVYDNVVVTGAVIVVDRDVVVARGGGGVAVAIRFRGCLGLSSLVAGHGGLGEFVNEFRGVDTSLGGDVTDGAEEGVEVD